MSAPFIAALVELVGSAEYGAHKYELGIIKNRIPYSKDRYVLLAFWWATAMETEAPALVFVNACNSVAGVRGHPRIPDDPQHLFDMLGTTNVRRFVEDGAREERDQGRFCPPDQLGVELPDYYSKLRFPANEAYAYRTEYWLQSGNRESAIHVDHGRVISYLPPCAQSAFKIWVVFPQASVSATVFNYGNKENSVNRMLETSGSSVLIQRPGDVVVLNNLVYHAVLLAYKKGTPEDKKWGGIFGDVVVCEADRVASFRYATKLASGVKRDSRGAWESLLSAYCTMEGRSYDPENFQNEKKRFYEKLELPAKSEKARAGAMAKKEKKRKLKDKLAAVRAAKQKK